MLNFLTILVLIYILMTGLLILGWMQSEAFQFRPLLKLPPIEEKPFLVTVIIPVRNEATNILALLEDLSEQLMDAKRYEVLIVDDYSEDHTCELVEAYIPKAPYALKLLHRSVRQHPSPKKDAITLGVKQARGELIVTTDGDCRVGSEWLAVLWQFYEKNQAYLISAGVTFDQERNLFQKMQTVEFASLIGSGAATLSLGFPSMCNGANLAYPKRIFEEVKGYEGFDQTASGDDEFLLHKIAQKYPERIYFLKHPAVIVKTKAQASVQAFFQQRKRWASKWKYYARISVKILAFFIFALNLSLVLATFLLILGHYPFSSWCMQVLAKCTVEWIFLGLVLTFLRKSSYLFLIPGVQLFYPLYVIIFGLVGLRGGYQWKGRKLH